MSAAFKGILYSKLLIRHSLNDACFINTKWSNFLSFQDKISLTSKPDASHDDCFYE